MPSRRLFAPRSLILLALATQAGGCYTATNYLDPEGPRYAGLTSPALGGVAAPTPPVLRAAAFNIKYGEEMEAALEVIRDNPELGDADFLLLQEVDARGTEWMAGELGMSWVYYPASLRNDRGFGNAVLSRWPLEGDEKVLLPHQAYFGGNRRIATAVDARVGDTRVRVYSVHLATPVNQTREEREEQLWTILEDAASHPHVIIGGDLNSGSLGELALEAGYQWPTRKGPRTVWFNRVDHILYRGLVPVWGETAGTVTDNGGSSDHLPVWALGRLREPAEAARRP